MKLNAGQRLSVLSEQQIPEQENTNLGILRELLYQISSDIVTNSKLLTEDRVILQVRNSPDYWIVEQAFVSSFQSAGFRILIDSLDTQHNPVTDSSSRPNRNYRIEIVPVKMQVQYDGIFHDGMFGSRKCRRTIVSEIAYMNINAETKELRSNGTLSKSFSDTVFVDMIPGLETPNIQSTHASLPEGSFLDRIFEPIVIAGAAGVAIFLFFNIRS